MAWAGVLFKEIRFVIEDELTQVYVLCEAQGDCPIGVQGWHHKTFPKSKDSLSILKDWGSGKEDPVMWPQRSPTA